MIFSTARDFIQKDKLDEYKKLITKLIDETRKEEANVSYDLYSDIENEGEFVLLEQWENQEGLDNHFKTKHFTTIVPEIQKLQSKPSIVNIYKKFY